jgi:hypothetical protein
LTLDSHLDCRAADQPFAWQALRDVFAVMLERATEREACRMMVGLSALAVEPQVRLWRNDRRFASGEMTAGSPLAK